MTPIPRKKQSYSFWGKPLKREPCFWHAKSKLRGSRLPQAGSIGLIKGSSVPWGTRKSSLAASSSSSSPQEAQGDCLRQTVPKGGEGTLSPLPSGRRGRGRGRGRRQGQAVEGPVLPLSTNPKEKPALSLASKKTIRRQLSIFRKKNQISRVQLTLVSPEERFLQLVRVLPNGGITGQIMSPKTLNYKTLKPEKYGLFCERTFGPMQDFTCACGKKQRKQALYCPDCEVEFTSSKVRRYRLGYIRLAVPVAHSWFLRGRPSYISLLLDIKKKQAESIAYGTTNIFNSYQLDFGKRILRLRQTFSEQVRKRRQTKDDNIFKIRPDEPDVDSMTVEEVQLFVNMKCDDFWIPTRDFLAIRTADWTKKDYLRRKPFYQVPMIRDHFHIRYRMKPNHLVYTEKYLFPRKRKTTARPWPKYRKIVDHSMICNDTSQSIEILLGGGLAFYHLFSKIDCYRFQTTLEQYLRTVIAKTNYLLSIEKTRKLEKEEMWELRRLTFQKTKTARRIKLLKHFWKTGSRPEWMFISILPILPPDLRPIIKMSNDQLAISDLNRLYQKLIRRNRTVKKSLVNIQEHLGLLDSKKLAEAKNLDEIRMIYDCHAFRFSTSILSFQQNLLQRATDDLLENGKAGSTPMCGVNNKRPLKSLSDILKGKKGRFRLNLLGKRVDYSGRSVIVVGPTLQLHQCGLPKEIALELFQSILIQTLMKVKLAKTIISAKKLIQRRHPIIWSLLNQILDHHPVFLNRAPTLHRLGVQAFLPKLVRGKAILLHPLVCPAFNADFDGDQMGVHLPLSVEAKSEAWSLMLSTQNILSPATGDPLITPSQDMVLGCYYFTKTNPNYLQKQSPIYFADFHDVYKAYVNKSLHAHERIWLKWPSTFYSENLPGGNKTLEIRLRRFLGSQPNGAFKEVPFNKGKGEGKGEGVGVSGGVSEDTLSNSHHRNGPPIWGTSESLWGENTTIAINRHETFTCEGKGPQDGQHGFQWPLGPFDPQGDLKDRYILTTVGRAIINKEFDEKVHHSRVKFKILKK